MTEVEAGSQEIKFVSEDRPLSRFEWDFYCIVLYFHLDIIWFLFLLLENFIMVMSLQKPLRNQI